MTGLPGNLDPSSSSGRLSAVDKLEIRKRVAQLQPYLEYAPLSSPLMPYRDAEAKAKIEAFVATT